MLFTKSYGENRIPVLYSHQCTKFHVSLCSVACHLLRQVIYIFDEMIVHFLFVFEIKDFFNHCGWKGT